MTFFDSFDLSTIQWIGVIIVALLVGFSKTGISGVGMLNILLVASIFGGKLSTGIILPMLLVGDVIAVKYYNRHADWHSIKRLIPWALIGILIGAITGNYINDHQFQVLIAIIVLVCLGILMFSEMKGEDLNVPHKVWFYALTGIACGFTSMIGNAAGPILSIYLLAIGLKKNNFIGTAAWFFFILNLTKMPLQIFVWHNINLQTGLLVLVLIPVIVLGAYLGIIVIKKINERFFRYIVLSATLIAAIKLFF
ncbi:MAG: sulfite exporter TauE/SafE family protein [Vallitaleaceae bacterium]|jgi:uncharacterized membrane protein YfcA|nr:sulfite exporter TauE/SafE family protein [Vallitaleaceae bacterium]